LQHVCSMLKALMSNGFILIWLYFAIGHTKIFMNHNLYQKKTYNLLAYILYCNFFHPYHVHGEMLISTHAIILKRI
jgi:hypothetical protein